MEQHAMSLKYWVCKLLPLAASAFGCWPACGHDSSCLSPLALLGYPSGFACSFGQNLHEQITLIAAGSLGLPDCAVSRIGDFAGSVDFGEYTLPPSLAKIIPWKLAGNPKPNGFYKASHHFDRGPRISHEVAFRNGVAYLQQMLSSAQADFAGGHPSEGMTFLGMALHALQDFFSHSNFADPDPMLALPPAEQPMAIDFLFGRSAVFPPDLMLTYYDPDDPHADDSSDFAKFSHEDHAKDNFSRPGYPPCGGTPGCASVYDLSVTNSALLISMALGISPGGLCSNQPGRPVTPVSSLDPNDKVGSTGIGTSRFVGTGQTGYSVYYQNQPTATAPAQAVTVTDRLDLSLDPSTLTLGPITFPNQVVNPPSIPLSVSPFTTTVDLRPATNLLVQVAASVNTSTATLNETFQSLDPTTDQPPTDPTAGFLPPGAGGSVFFTVLPKSNVATGTVIQNTATVVFDSNAPLNTPTWSNTIDATAPVSHVAALPATEPSASFAVNWSGTDVGSGVQYYTIYVSDSGGPFNPWLSQTSSTSATFGGANGHSYSFYSVATDFVGNREAAKAAPDTTTTINVITVSPVAKAGGPYDFCPNLSNGRPIYTPWYLDGSQSTNPDNGKTDGTPGAPASTIIAYDWDFNGLNTFTDAHGAQVRVDTGAGNFFTKQGQSFAVSLRVTNNDNLAFPTIGLPAGLTGIASAQVFVHNASDPDCTHCVNTVSGLAKAPTPGVPGDIQLYWTDTNSPAFPFDHYNIYRSVNADFSDYQQIAGARSIYGIPAAKVANPSGGTEVLVDANVVVNGSYYYRVAPATAADVETCSSNVTVKVTLPKGR
jgi:hypothetical protein